MKFRTQKIAALMTVAVLGISTLGSMPVMAEENTETADDGEAMAVDGEAMAVDGDAMAVDGEAISSDLISGTFKPSEVTCQAQDSY